MTNDSLLNLDRYKQKEKEATRTELGGLLSPEGNYSGLPGLRIRICTPPGAGGPGIPSLTV
jgi:hypothetical protein